MSLSRFFRQVVSGDSIRYQEAGFDLNLSYITPRIIGKCIPLSFLKKWKYLFQK